MNVSFCRITVVLVLYVFIPRSSSAQYWHVLPPVAGGDKASTYFSNDERKVFYLASDGATANIWCVPIADKYNRITVAASGTTPAIPVTNFTDRGGIVRFVHLLNLPEILYQRLSDDGKDYHIYRLKDDGTGTLQDLTPGPAGATAELLGISYNGRFVYYTMNKVNKDKIDVYRYDAQQYITDLVFPNDKQYRALAWSRDQAKLLLEDPNSGNLLQYEIESTLRNTLVKPEHGKFAYATLDPTNHDLIIVDKSGSESTERVMTVGSGTWSDVAKGNISSVDFSPNGKYTIIVDGKNIILKETATSTTIPLPEGAHPVAIAPKETMLVYGTDTPDARVKLFLYDIAKKASFELATIR